jgi:uncharacterized protein YecT (DUF1311 family)/uncharacterized protein YraI
MLFKNSVLVATIAATVLLSAARLAYADDMSDMADWCATQATAPSSVVICSDSELRRMAVIRNKIFADARANLSEDDMKKLNAAQNQWIHEYTGACGASVNGPPVSLPIPQEIIGCYRQAGREQIAKLVRDLREVIPNYQVPIVSGLTSSPIAGSLVTGKTTFQVIGIPSNDVLNIREQPTSQSRIVSMIPPNGTGIVYEGHYSGDGRWLFIRYGDVTGWVASRYLRESSLSSVSAAPPTASAQPPTTSAPTPASSTDRAEKERAAEGERQRLRKNAEQEQLTAKLKDLGFQLLTPVDLDLDWKTFMTNNTKVAVRGTYVEANDVEELFTPENKDHPTIRLYTDVASRSARKVMLECRNSNFVRSSCEMVVGATIQGCIRNKGELNEKEVPCLKVQEAYVIP